MGWARVRARVRVRVRVRVRLMGWARVRARLVRARVVRARVGPRKRQPVLSQRLTALHTPQLLYRYMNMNMHEI